MNFLSSEAMVISDKHKNQHVIITTKLKVIMTSISLIT